MHRYIIDPHYKKVMGSSSDFRSTMSTQFSFYLFCLTKKKNKKKQDNKKTPKDIHQYEKFVERAAKDFSVNMAEL